MAGSGQSKSRHPPIVPLLLAILEARSNEKRRRERRLRDQSEFRKFTTSVC
jgi:hypothetical protein